MAKNIDQVFTANPITSNASTDLMYFGQSPYGPTDDAAMTYANFSAQFGAPFTPSALTASSDTNVTLTLGGTPTTSLLHAASVTAGWTGTLSGTRGGTGVNNGASTITLGGSLTTSGAFASTFTMTGVTNVTFPTSGTLATTAGTVSSVSGTTNRITSTGGTTPVIDISASYVGQSSITTLGTITTGVWTGTNIALANGGTNATLTASNGGIVFSSASALGILSGTATASQVLLSGANTTPAWSVAVFPSAIASGGKIMRSDGSTGWTAAGFTMAASFAANTIVFAASSNNLSGLATANSSSLVTNSTGVPAWSGAMTNGQIILGSTGATPTAATLTAGTGISITNGAGSVTVASTGLGSVVWNDVSGTTQSAAVNQGYIISNASQTTVSIPATAAEGSVFSVAGKGAAGWILQMNTGQTCHFGNAATSSAGSLTSTNQWDAVTILCVTANTTFSVISSIGNLTVA